MREIRLIVNADDFGMSRGITDAIIAAHRHGFLTSASLTASVPGAEYAVSRARSFPSLSVGIHLNVCYGRPILRAREVPSLVGPDGNFHPPREMTRRLWTWRAASAEIESEFRAQIRWMKDRGIVPTHADSHHHMHLYSGAATAFARAVKAEGIRSVRACCCVEWPASNLIAGPYGGNVFRRALVQTYRGLLQSTIFRGFHSPDRRVVISTNGRRDRRECWKLTLENIPSGTFELACHPGLFDPGFSEVDAIHSQRQEEFLCLTDRDLTDVIERRSIRLISYRDLPPRERAEAMQPEAAA